MELVGSAAVVLPSDDALSDGSLREARLDPPGGACVRSFPSLPLAAAPVLARRSANAVAGMDFDRFGSDEDLRLLGVLTNLAKAASLAEEGPSSPLPRPSGSACAACLGPDSSVAAAVPLEPLRLWSR